jgi:hypothetical protein
MSVSETQAASAQTALRQLLDGYRISQLLFVAAELGIADLLKEGAKPYDELAQATHTHPRALFRVLRGLASVGVFAQVDGERFENNEMSALLVSDAPNSLRPAARMVGHEFYAAWGNVMHTVRTGETAFDALFGQSDWDYRSQNVEEGQLFNALMSTASAMRMDRVAASLNWGQFGTIVDVGGGQGTMIATILTAHPNVKGIVYDLEGPASAARARLAEAGLSERAFAVAGSFMDSVPAGGDAYILSRILHDWQDEPATRILQNCRRAMATGATLVVVERMLDALAPAPDAAMGDLMMMVMNGGRERTADEFRRLLEATGFQLTQVIPTQMPFQVIQAVAV